MANTSEDFYRRYFSSLFRCMKDEGIPIEVRTPSKQQFQIIYSWSGPIDIAVNVLRRDKEIRVDLTLKSKDAADQYSRLESDKDDIETVIGKKLEWDPNRPKKERQIIWRLEDTDPKDESDWPRQHAWLAARLVAFRLAFRPRIEAWG